MIHWLLQSLDDCPETLRGDATPAWLSAAEQARLHSFKVEKRRRDWLLGRWTAKNLVQRYVAQRTGETPKLATIFIGADADGAPYVSCKLRGAKGENRLPVSLSISHSHGVAFCGLVEIGRLGDYEMKRLEIGDWRLGHGAQSPISNLPISNLPISNLLISQSPSLGCDIEFIEPRELSFVRSFFTAEEMAAVMADDRNRDVLTTAIWSGKEAVLKALREGLRIDTRRITCRFDAFATAPLSWTPFQIGVEDGIAAQFPGVWSGWWCIKEQFVLTTALLSREEHTAGT
ncbi:MAG: 4'-phosphopantetheinyl transferase family protein [Caldilinea sp.]